MKNTLVVIPVYGKWDYALKAVDSLLGHPCDALVVDDCGEPPPRGLGRRLVANDPARAGTACYYRFPKNQGLTEAWNYGLRYARTEGYPTTILGNSDLLFAPGSVVRLAEGAVEYDFAGPYTNAPGTSAWQDVRREVQGYKPDDSPEALLSLSAALGPLESRQVESLNGFCWAAMTATWWLNAFDREHVFDPKNRMTFQEYEFQRRTRKAGRICGLVRGAFVFHYRSVTRGDKYGKGQEFRPGRRPRYPEKP